ncbi:MAG: deoxyribose-phosphate aldolase [Acidobacteria bacterium]|nr:deoxyribose-phosphate aldolase [Acidobacteriota bacterium]
MAAAAGGCGGRPAPSAASPARPPDAVETGAWRRAVRAARGTPLEVAALIDHTLLEPGATRRKVEKLCGEAGQFGFATVCVNPVWVPVCVRLLAGTSVRVCSVVGFPFGASTAGVKAAEARRAILDGAREIDMALNLGLLKSGELGLTADDIEGVTAVCREGGALSKVIIEAALLSQEEKVAACVLARAAGADFVKTSTGFGPGGATVADVALMRRVVGEEMGVKAAGGIRDLETLRAMVEAGATRIGSSAGVRIVLQVTDSLRSGGGGRGL